MNVLVSLLEKIQDYPPFSLFSRLKERTVHQAILAITIFLVLLSSFLSSRNIELIYAHLGYTPAHYVYKTYHPENFEKDFPSGVENFDKSSVMNLYKYAYEYLHIEPLTYNFVFIWIEAIGLALAIYWLSRVLLPNAPPLVRMLCVAFFMAGQMRYIDIANFGGVTFYGHYYVAIDIVRIITLIFFLRKRIILTAVSLAVLFTIHPVHAVFMSVFLAVVGGIFWRDYLKWKPLLAGLGFFLAIVAPWIYTKYNLGNFVGTPNTIDAQTWIDFARFGNYHLFPLDFGRWYLTTKLIPYFIICGLWIYYFKRDHAQSEIARKVFYGSIAIFILSLCGLVIAHTIPVPSLIKLALHRSCNLFMLVVIPFLTYSLIKDIYESHWLQQIVAFIISVGVLSISPFMLFGLILLVFLAKPSLQNIPLLKRKISWRPHAVILIFLISAPIASSIWLLKIGYWSSYTRIEERHQEAIAYENAQLWVKKHTAIDALIMPPPNALAAGQDVAMRSSFGTMRDWIHDCCLYNSNKKWFDEGLKRFNEYGVDITPYLAVTDRPGVYHAFELASRLNEIYHSQKPDWYQHLAKEYSINYFIFRKKELKAQVPFIPVYENELYIIYDASKPISTISD